MNLRDHDAPCEHGWFITCDKVGCPGGGAVSVDYAAAHRAMDDLFGKGDHRYPASEIVDAALGLTDE